MIFWIIFGLISIISIILSSIAFTKGEKLENVNPKQYEGVVVVIPYWNREARDVREIVGTYLSYGIVRSVVIRERHNGKTLGLDGTNSRIRVIREPNDLRLRFSGLRMAPTSCIYITDDDHIVSQPSLVKLHKRFLKEPDRIHTFYGRTLHFRNGRPYYRPINASQDRTAMAIGRSMMVDRDRMAVVSDLLIKRQDELGILSLGNEDIAFSTLFTLTFNTLPRELKQNDERKFKSGELGLSSRQSHTKVRTDYLRRFFEVHGDIFSQHYPKKF